MLACTIVMCSTALIILLSYLYQASAQCTTTCSSCNCGCGATESPRNYVTNPCDLDCDFDKPCRWRNGTNGVEDDFDWPIATSVILDHWHSIPRGRDGPCDPFAYTRGAFGTKHADNRAILVSDPIHCQLGNGMLKFWYWKTALYPSLRVCIRKVPGPCGVLHCIATIHGFHRQEWIMRTVIIHQQTEPFEIVFEARFKHNFDIIGLDKISYSARLCEPALAQPITTVSTARPTIINPTVTGPITVSLTPEPTTRGFDTIRPSPATIGYTPAPQPIIPSPPPASYGPLPVIQQTSVVYSPPGQIPLNDAGPCPALDCSFDRGSPCQYVSSGAAGSNPVQLPPGSTLRQWQVTKSETSNSLTGIFSDLTGTGMYAYAGETTNNLDMYVLESPRFTITSSGLVEFSYYLAGIQGRLRGCVNGVVDCRFESLGKDIKSDARRWRRGTFQLEPGSYTVTFVGDNLGKNYVIGLDNIELKSASSATLLACA